MLDIMYDVPYREGMKECKITEGVILRMRSRCSPSRRRRSRRSTACPKYFRGSPTRLPRACRGDFDSGLRPSLGLNGNAIHPRTSPHPCSPLRLPTGRVYRTTPTAPRGRLSHRRGGRLQSAPGEDAPHRSTRRRSVSERVEIPRALLWLLDVEQRERVPPPRVATEAAHGEIHRVVRGEGGHSGAAGSRAGPAPCTGRGPRRRPRPGRAELTRFRVRILHSLGPKTAGRPSSAQGRRAERIREIR